MNCCNVLTSAHNSGKGKSYALLTAERPQRFLFSLTKNTPPWKEGFEGEALFCANQKLRNQINRVVISSSFPLQTTAESLVPLCTTGLYSSTKETILNHCPSNCKATSGLFPSGRSCSHAFYFSFLKTSAPNKKVSCSTIIALHCNILQ